MADIYEGQRSFDLVLRLNQNYTQSIDQVKAALIDIGNGRKVPLEEIAEVVSVGGPNTITRENVQRKIVVSANVSGRDLKGVVEDIKANIGANINLPEGYRVEYGGQFESAESASRTLLITSFLALCVIFLLLYGEFKNLTLSAIVLLNLPLALIGGVFAVFFTSDIVSIPSIIGFITLFGIATRNGILLISKYQHMQQHNEELQISSDELKSEGIDSEIEVQDSKLREIVVHGSMDRLNPILMTALTAALALIPLVFQGDKPLSLIHI